MVILVTGVAGVGKSTIGAELALQLGWTFLDADKDHPPANIAKMRDGHPLTDEDRAPWLAAVRARIRDHVDRGENVVVACSALKRSHREYLKQAADPTLVVQLAAPPDIVRPRINRRTGHFMRADLLTSQYDALEPDQDALVVDATASAEEVVASVRAAFRV